MCDKSMNVCAIRESGNCHVLCMHGFPHFSALYFLLVSTNTLPTPSPLDSSWTEDTRSCIFSDTALHLGKDGQEPLAAELDMQIEQKFEEFDVLAATARNLFDREHHLTDMVRGFSDL